MDGCRKNRYADATFTAFDTVVRLRAYGSPARMQCALQRAEDACRRYEALLSRTIPTSDVARLNAAHGAWTRMDPCTFAVVEAALSYCAASEGAFDITIGAVSHLWDMKRGIVPAPEALDEAAKHVDWHCVQLDADTSQVRLADPHASVDLGGIAKGWIADALDDLMRTADAEGWVIDLGGNVMVGGRKPDGSPWKVGVRDPSAPERVARVLSLERGSVVTSGTYERTCVVNGVRYHHILDPRTGMPVQTEYQAATVVCERSLDAEGFSTTLLILGPERARALKASHPEILEVYYT